MEIRKHIPNAITCLNVLSGCIACVMAFEQQYGMAAMFIYAAAVFDFFDGFAARFLHAYSEIGKQLDSLADCISFGVAPGIIMFSMLKNAYFPFWLDALENYIPYIAFLIPLFSVLRLAKFNVDERQENSFIGLPTPANSLFFASIASSSLPLFANKYGILLVMIVLFFSYLLIAEFPMFSLKIKRFNLKENAVQLIFLVLSIIILFLGGFKYLFLIIILYILMSAILLLVNNILPLVKEK